MRAIGGGRAHQAPATNRLLEVMSSLTFRILQYVRLHPPSLTGFFWQISKSFQVPKHSLQSE